LGAFLAPNAHKINLTAKIGQNQRIGVTRSPSNIRCLSNFPFGLLS
jgi:hypothetical protein